MRAVAGAGVVKPAASRLSHEVILGPENRSPSVCFCDIPFQHLSVHLAKYGMFGLSLAKPDLIRMGARPVTYIPMRRDDAGTLNGRSLLRHIEQTYRGFREQLNDSAHLNPHHIIVRGTKPPTPTAAIAGINAVFVRDVLGFLKPFDSELRSDAADYFYAEREWRKLGNVVFDPAQVKRVIVAPGYAAQLAKEMPEYYGRIVVAP